MSNKVWSVEIVHPWYVRPSSDGSGFALCVDRGIPCEGHTQATTAHDFNQVGSEDGGLESMRAIVAKHREHLDKAIDGFVTMQNALGDMASNVEKRNFREPGAQLEGAAEALGYAVQGALIRFLSAEVQALETGKRSDEC